MHGYHYVWLIWSGAFLAAFFFICGVSPAHRPAMLRAGAATAALGLTEPLFVPEYWNPPSLFSLAQRTGFDIESLIFTFSIGGVAVVLYNRLTGRSMAPISASMRSALRHRLHGFAVLVPAFAFVLLSAFGWNPIYPAVLAMAAGGLAAVWCRPDLLAKTVAGGLLFLGYYALFMLGLIITAPGYIEQAWNLPDLSGLFVAGIPVEELFFGFSFGLYWSSVYEHLTGIASSRAAGPGPDQRPCLDS